MPTNCVVYPSYDSHNARGVIDTDELLRLLEQKGVRNVDMARALDLPDSRIPEIKDRRRALKLDEAVKLVRAFRLEQAQEATPVATPILRLAVRHVAGSLGVDPSEDLIANLSEDLRAFSVFASDPRARQSIESAEGFFEALRLRRPTSEQEVPLESDPARGS